MSTRLLAALAVIGVTLIAIVAVRVMQRTPEQSGTPAAAVTSLAVSPSPLAEASGSPEAAPPGAPAAASPSTETSLAGAPASAPAVGLVTPPPSVAETASPGAGTPGVPATAVPTVAPTDDPNLLALTNGAFARSWTIGAGRGGNVLPVGGSYGIDPAFRGTVTFVFEMPSTAHLSRVAAVVHAAKPVRVRIAIATTRNAFADAGAIEIPASDDAEHSVNLDKDARFVRATIERAPGSTARIDRIAAYGTPGPAETAPLAGTWINAEYPDGAVDDQMFAGVRGSVPRTLPTAAAGFAVRTLVQGDDLTWFPCNDRSPAWHGTISNGVARSSDRGKAQVTGDGTLLSEYVDGRMRIAMRAKAAAGCSERFIGHGANVLALIRDGHETSPEIDPTFIPGYRFDALPLFALDQRHLQAARFAILLGDCLASSDLLPAQQRLLLDWVAAGHKLIVHDADECGSSDYSFIPYAFKTVATGARGARGQVLALADPSALGAGPSDRAHALDTQAYLHYDNQQLGDADIMQTDDPHWCGHLYAQNSVGASGWVHAYARHGRGLIIYNGLDRDDITHIKPAIDILRYEYAFPAQNELPCNARVASRLALFPSVERELPAGKAVTVRVPMSLSYVERTKASRDVTLSISGDSHFSVSELPAHVRVVSGAATPVTATISLPAGWSGVHAFTVFANGGTGATAQATIRIDGSVALASAFEKQRRVRIYGIHFDVASARIQARSEATIAQIAAVLRNHPAWRMRVEGHTDSDGGADYNQTLSVQRAQAVVNDLVTRYRIARARLVAAGYGLTRPVASNATEAGKALNRRVELVRL